MTKAPIPPEMIDTALRRLDAQPAGDARCNLFGGAFVVRRGAVSGLEPMVYEPLVCLVLQGSKVVRSGTGSAQPKAGDGLLVSHDIPVVSQIVDAAPGRPYLAVVLPLDLHLLRAVAEQMWALPEGGQAGVMRAEPVDAPLADAVHRLMRLEPGSEAEAVLGPLIQREIHYLLLTAAHAAGVRALLARDSTASRIARAIAHLRERFAESLPAAELAPLAGMSQSTFHAHFKAVTGTTPLQYQKDMRLLAARERLRNGGDTVTGAAFAVGYESPAHFSRDYSRKFGISPREDRGRGILAAA